MLVQIKRREGKGREGEGKGMGEKGKGRGEGGRLHVSVFSVCLYSEVRLKCV